MTEGRELILIGGGEHARVVLDAALSSPERWVVRGYVDRTEQPRLELPWLGDDDAVLVAATRGLFVIAVAGVGATGVRARMVIAERYAAAGAAFARITHGSAWVSQSARVADGVVIGAGAIVNAGAEVGAHCIVNTSAVIEHDVKLGPFCHAGPGVVIGGGTTVGAGVVLGLGCRVRDHVDVGDGATVGMGATVVASVPVGVTVAGTPARRLEKHA